jgi:hypothetical protein
MPAFGDTYENPDENGLVLRARYEHFKSTTKERRTYVTLGIRAIEGQVVVVYMSEYEDATVIYERSIEEFMGAVVVHDESIDRYTLTEEREVITGKKRDELLEEYDRRKEATAPLNNEEYDYESNS